jgi:hypothetical protein
MFIKLILCLLFLLNPVFAEEKTEEVKKTDEKSGDLPEWVFIENRLTTLESQIKSKKANIEKLIEEKDHLKSTDPKVKTLIKEIISLHKEVSKDIEEYEKQKTILKYRFPEKGAAAKRKYQKIELKSIDEIEAYQGVDGKLTKSVKKMRSQYGASETEEEKTKKLKKKKLDEPEGAIVIQK